MKRTHYNRKYIQNYKLKSISFLFTFDFHSHRSRFNLIDFRFNLIKFKAAATEIFH